MISTLCWDQSARVRGASALCGSVALRKASGRSFSLVGSCRSGSIHQGSRVPEVNAGVFLALATSDSQKQPPCDPPSKCLEGSGDQRRALLDYRPCAGWTRPSAGAGGSGLGGLGFRGFMNEDGQWWSAGWRGQQPGCQVRAGSH